MSTVIAFPKAAMAAGRKAVTQGRRPRQPMELPGPRVVILPVVRIERHGQGTGPQTPARERRHEDADVVHVQFGTEPPSSRH